MGEFDQMLKTVNQVRSMRAAKYSNYALTEIGKQKAEEYGGDGKEFEVLNDLNDNGPSTLREVAQRVHIDEKVAKVILNRLIEKQRVTKVAR
jgi:DNA-binding MarR family transcriptional regulator